MIKTYFFVRTKISKKKVDKLSLTRSKQDPKSILNFLTIYKYHYSVLDRDNFLSRKLKTKTKKILCRQELPFTRIHNSLRFAI